MRASHNRLRILSLLIILFAVVLVGKLYSIQIVSGESFRQKAEHQYIAGINYFDRGSIFFSTKDGTRVPAAIVRDGFGVTLDTRRLAGSGGNLSEIYEQINEIINIDRASFLTKASRTNRHEEIIRRIGKDEADRIQALSIPGVVVSRQRWRAYPGDSMAAHTIGLIGYSGDTIAGRYGLERQHEAILVRTRDNAFANFFVEIFANIKKTVAPDQELEGDIVTTIEPSTQAFLETEIDKINKEYSSDFTGAIVINPRTGAIYALGLTPSFDPNSPQSQPNPAVFRNKFVEDRYEMGSIIKALTIAAGLDSGAITSRTTFNDPGCMTLNSRKFCNYDGKSHGSSVSMQTALSKSLNTGMAYAVARMGNKTFSEYMFNFGLGEITGIDLPNEGKSLVSNLKTNRDLEYAQASFGQGIALTPLITVRALSALANGGTLVTPHLTKEIRYKIGPSKTIKYPEPHEQPRVISVEASEEVSRMLTEVVDYTLRYGQIRLENYSVAAKTGTAQIAKEGGGGYYADRYLHSFFGYFPSYDPQFLIFMYTYNPKNVQYASETLTDGFFNTVRFLINYYDVPPDRETVPAERGYGAN